MSVITDKMFFIPISVALIAGVILANRHLGSSIKSVLKTDSNPKINTSPSIAQADSQSIPQKNHQQSEQLIPIKKLRPKSGNSNWYVANEIDADSGNLNDVLLNMKNGDLIKLGSGKFDLNLNSITVNRLEIQGVEGSELNFVRSYSKNPNLEIHLEDVKISSSEKYLHLHRIRKIVFNRVNAAGAFNVTLKSQSELEIKDSVFNGVVFSLDDHVKAYFENIKMVNSKYFVRMNDFSSLEVKGGDFNNFSSNAFSSRSSFVKLKLERIKITSGEFAFYGHFNNQNTNLKNIELSRLFKISSKDEKLNCSDCNIYDIQR